MTDLCITWDPPSQTLWSVLSLVGRIEPEAAGQVLDVQHGAAWLLSGSDTAHGSHGLDLAVFL